MMHAAFAGFAALPAGGGDGADAWWAVLGVSSDADMGAINGAYLREVKRVHPDNGGDPEAFHAIQAAFTQAKAVRA